MTVVVSKVLLMLTCPRGEKNKTHTVPFKAKHAGEVVAFFLSSPVVD